MPRTGLPVAAVAVVLSLAGCGGDDGGSRGAGVFESAGCGNCHTLADAGTKGTTGPDLDAARYDSARVFEQVTRGGGGMPAFDRRLTYREITDVAAYVERVSGTRATSSSKAFERDDTKLSDCSSEDGECLRQALGNVAHEEGPKRALSLFADAIARNPAVERGCHPTAHTIGAAALQHYKGDVGKAFADGDATCSSGYYHGLLEWKLAGTSKEDVAAESRAVCASRAVRSTLFTNYQCVHGLGHGLMLYHRNDLPAALRLCHGLATDFDRVSCSGGVFMENQQPSYGEPSRWLKDDDLLYPCNSDIVGRSDKLYCYLMVTSQILPRVGRDWSRTAGWCRRSDRDFVPICFQSMGRDASGDSRQEPLQIVEKCRLARPDGEGDCLFGAVRDVLNEEPGDPRAGELCRSVPRRHRAYCFHGLGSILGTVHRTRRARAVACGRFGAGADRAECLRGASTVSRVPR